LSKKGIDILFNKLLSKESVGRVVLTVTSASTILLGSLLVGSKAELDESERQLGEAQIQLEQIENKFLQVESDNQKLSKRQEELVSQLHEYKTINDELMKDKDKLQEQMDAQAKDVKKIRLLEQIVTAEAKGESLQGKVAVAEVILNRVESEKFPNTVRGVVYQKNQFSPVMDGSINNEPTEEAKEAVKIALEGSNKTGGALYFYNPRIATSRWLDTRPTTATIGSHVFKK
jgi:N-acetylmuramoyl-L-alanine amidase